MAYKRYGAEWEKEVMKNPKKLIVAMLRRVAIERDGLYTAQQNVQPTIATAALEDSPFEAGMRRNTVVLSSRNSG